MTTVGRLLDTLKRELTDADIEEARLEARLIVAAAGNISEARLIGYPDDEIDKSTKTKIQGFTRRRISGEPLAYILGRKEFWSLPFRVTSDTLIPRPDSETAIELALDYIDNTSMGRSAPLHILDLGTGTGCLLLSLLSELPNATGIGVDFSEQACAVARINADTLKLAHRTCIVEDNWELSDLQGLIQEEHQNLCFDIILCNPPYIPHSDIAGLGQGVREFEPYQALDGGPDGLSAYRNLAPKISPLLHRNGAVIFEFGIGQAADIKEILENNDFEVNSIRSDIAKVDRCILATVVIS